MTYYFIIKDDLQCGPFTKEELKQQGVTPETPIWHEGLPDWCLASELPELTDLFERPQSQQMPPPPPNFGYTYPSGSQTYQNPQYPGMQHNNHTNWLPWAIVGTILGTGSCIALITGIIAIVYSCNANSAYQKGNVYEGDTANNTAKIMTIITLGLVVLSFIFGLFMGLFSVLMTGMYADY